MRDVNKPVSPRRALLQRGAALTLGTFGLGAGSANARGPEPPEAGSLRLFARRRQALAARRGKSEAVPPSGSYGDLMAAVDGPAVGAFQAHGMDGRAATSGLSTAPRLELQTFTLEDGVLFGLGAASPEGERACAVLGGTGRFAGAQGTYLEREAQDPQASRGIVEFVFSLKS